MLVSWGLLLACTAASAGAATPWPGNLAWGVALLAPLLLPVAGLLRRRRRTHAWASLCVAPVLVHGLTEIVANPAGRLAAATLLLASFAAFAALVVYLRATRPARASAQATPGP